MSEETPQETIARLERELAAAKVDSAEASLRAARLGVPPSGPALPPDIASLLSTAFQSVDQAGYGDRFSALRGFAAPPSAPVGHPTDTRLSDPPRSVPIVYRVALLSWRMWDAFTVLMVCVAPIALYIFVPWTFAVVVVALTVVLFAIRVRGAVTRIALLKRGVVATVTGAELTSRGTYFSGTTYNNMIVPQAIGWDVTRRVYSGPASTTRISYSIGAGSEQLTLRGLPYVGGVILADSSRPARALCVSSFPYDLNRDENGDWVGTLSTRSWTGLVFGLVFWIALFALAVVAVTASMAG